MNDPFVPRHPPGAAPEVGHAPSPVDLLRTLGLLFRGLALFVTLGLFLFGVYYAVDVFLYLGVLVKRPAAAQEAIDQLAQIIDAPQLIVNVEGRETNVGKLVATVLYGFGCLLWAWIPLTMMTASGRLLMILASGRRPPPPPPASSS